MAGALASIREALAGRALGQLLRRWTVDCQLSPTYVRLVCMSADRCDGHDAIDETLLDCFLELGLKERIQSAANFANAVEKLRRLRSAGDSDQAA